MIPTVEIDENGNIETLYTDKINLYELGLVHNVKRASYVEFSEDRQLWQVILSDGCGHQGEVVHEDKNREKAIEWEIENLSPGGKYYDNRN